ncbi:hypothetical protein, partial [Bacteroides thetaiotaomicron]|uniref:hypothetical protein n=1 Tax=Bacteroides thetaiotaomicron TaxID=818 RepID=UPI001A91D143
PQHSVDSLSLNPKADLPRHRCGVEAIAGSWEINAKNRLGSGNPTEMEISSRRAMIPNTRSRGMK